MNAGSKGSRPSSTASPDHNQGAGWKMGQTEHMDCNDSHIWATLCLYSHVSIKLNQTDYPGFKLALQCQVLALQAETYLLHQRLTQIDFYLNDLLSLKWQYIFSLRLLRYLKARYLSHLPGEVMLVNFLKTAKTQL